MEENKVVFCGEEKKYNEMEIALALDQLGLDPIAHYRASLENMCEQELESLSGAKFRL